MIKIEQGSGNVYADLGFEDAKAMLEKSRLVCRMQVIIKHRRLTHQQVADILGMQESALSAMLRGHFHDVTEMDLTEYLHRLGGDE